MSGKLENDVRASGRFHPSRRRLLQTAVIGVSAIAAGVVSLRYRRALHAAHVRLAQVDRRVISTHWGAVEYAERGFGEPVLVLHGIFQGCDGGLLSVRDLFPDRRVIAPSRFGYLGSSLPPNATPADQADALVAVTQKAVRHRPRRQTISSCSRRLRQPSGVRTIVWW